MRVVSGILMISSAVLALLSGILFARLAMMNGYGWLNDDAS